VLQKPIQFRYLAITLILLFLCWSSTAFAQNIVKVTPSKRTAMDFIPDQIGSLTASSRAENIDAAKLNSLFGSDSDLVREYGVSTAATRSYRSGKISASVSVLQMDQATHAYGLYRAMLSNSHITPDRHPSDERGEMTDKGFLFWQGRYFVLITDNAPTISEEVKSNRMQMIGDISNHIGAVQSDDPGIMRHLPEWNLVNGSEKYLVGPLGVGRFTQYGDASKINFEGGTEVAVGDYDINGSKGQLIIVEFQTPQFATQGMDRMHKYLDSLPPDQRGRIFLKREGNYAVEAIGFGDRAIAESLVDRVKYTYTVKWITKPPTSPYDLSSYRRDALRLIIAIFVLIGLAVLIAVGGGVFFGRLLFLRRRAQLKNVYSDAGGIIRLNLDDMINPALTENRNKLLSDGD